jgi:biotin carboxylase
MRVLMLSRARDWLGPPRLLRALADAGASTAYLAPRDSLLAHIRHADHRFTWHDDASMHRHDLQIAIGEYHPDRLLAADEPSVLWLHALHAHADTPEATRALIAASLGDPGSYLRCIDKLAVTRLATELGIDVPASAELDQDDATGVFVQKHGWPVALKSRRGFAGNGVYPCASLRELRHAQLHCPRDGGRMIQRFHEGTTWMSVFVAEHGTTLGQICFAKERQFPELTGPSSILRSGFDAGMQAATSRLVRALGFSGFGSIDFLRSNDGRDLLLEFNPRPTPACHLGKRLGVDLVAAYLDGAPRDNAAVARDQRIALFPQELRRDGSGAGLAGCWHDVPHDEPELLAALCRLLKPEARQWIEAAELMASAQNA